MGNTHTESESFVRWAGEPRESGMRERCYFNDTQLFEGSMFSGSLLKGRPRGGGLSSWDGGVPGVI
jgi:hypothetical protein